MFLGIDIGNSSITFGVFKNNDIVDVFRIDNISNADEYFYKSQISEKTNRYNIDSCGIISVSQGMENTIKSICDSLYRINSVILDYRAFCDMSILVEKPETVGIDRLINAYAIRDLASAPIIVVDAGTAITLDVVSKEGDFMGGVIMPGINMQFKSLYNNTSKLPLIIPAESKSTIGKNTENSILSGVIRGTAHAIDGLLSECTDELKETPQIVLTGGQGGLILKYINTKVNFVMPNLTLIGIKKIYNAINLIK